MTATAWALTNTGRQSLVDGSFDLDTDSFRIALFLESSNVGASSTTYAACDDEVASAYGYTQNAKDVSLALSGTTTLTVDETTSPFWTADGGSIVARFAAVYKVGGNVLCWSLLDDTPADVTATDGETFTVTIAAGGLFSIA